MDKLPKEFVHFQFSIFLNREFTSLSLNGPKDKSRGFH